MFLSCVYEVEKKLYGEIVVTTDSYLEGHELNLRPHDRPSSTSFFVVYLSLSKQMLG
jgi:hypothetical protein